MPDNQVTYAHTEADVVAATTLVIAAAPNRKYLRVQNDDGALTVWIKIGAAAVLNQGIKLGPGEYYEMRQDKNNVDPRVINGIASAAGPAVVLVTQA
ncbi:hypothetical protein LCGC14_1083380 [marine sediment metagenome]|uniref:Uncharacterized protein n=1 Tax=marine sediment metagenome TaxID=412755 RepID=A0A0F9MEQ5_9ZZZZ